MPRHLMVKREGSGCFDKEQKAKVSEHSSKICGIKSVSNTTTTTEMRRSPKKCLFPTESQTKSMSMENHDFRAQKQPSRNSPIPLSHPEHQINMLSYESYLPETAPSLPGGKTLEPVMRHLSHSRGQVATENHQPTTVAQSSAPPSKITNVNAGSLHKCPYKIFGVKKNLLLRSGVASFPTGKDLKKSPKRIPLSPLKSVGQTQATLDLSVGPNKRLENSIKMPLKLKFSDKENPESALRRTVNVTQVPKDDSPTDLTLSKSTMANISLDCGKPSQSPAVAPLYSPISSASESSNVSEDTDPSSTPSSSSTGTDDVIHYSVRPPNSNGPGTKLTLVRQSRPCPKTLPAPEAGYPHPDQPLSNTTCSSSNSVDLIDYQETPVDMTMKTEQKSTWQLRRSPFRENSSPKPSQEEPANAESPYGKSLTSGILHEIPKPIPSHSWRLFNDKENIPPGDEILLKVSSCHLRTSTPEPTFSQRLNRKRKKSRTPHLLSRPNTAPPAVCPETCFDRVSSDHLGGSSKDTNLPDGISGGGEVDSHSDHRSSPMINKQSKLGGEHKGKDNAESDVDGDDLCSTGGGSRQPFGLAGSWPPNTPAGIHRPLPTLGSQVSLPPPYHLPADLSQSATSLLNREYAYNDLYRRYYDNFQNGERMVSSNPPPLVYPGTGFSRIPLDAPGHSFFPNGELLRGPHSNNGFPDSSMQYFNGEPLNIKFEAARQSDQTSAVSEPSFRVPLGIGQSLPLPVTVKTERQVDSPMDGARDSSEPDTSHLDVPPASVQIDVVGMGEENAENGEGYEENVNDGQSSEQELDGYEKRGSTAASTNADSGLASDLSDNASGCLLRSNVITPPAGSDNQDEKVHTPEGTQVQSDSGCFVTPVQQALGKKLFPDPLGASTPMEDESLWRPWHKSKINKTQGQSSETPSTSSDYHAPYETGNTRGIKRNSPLDESLEYSQARKCLKQTLPETSGLSQDKDPRRFISPVMPSSSSKTGVHRVRQLKRARSPKHPNQAFAHPFSIAAMLKDSSSQAHVDAVKQQQAQERIHARSAHMSFTPDYPVHSALQTSAQTYGSLQSYSHPTVNDSPMNLSFNSTHPASVPVAASLRERLAYTAAHNEQFYQNAQIMLHGNTHIHSGQAVRGPFMPPYPIIQPSTAIAATFGGSDPVPNATQLHQLPGYIHNQRSNHMGPISTNSTYPSMPTVSSTIEEEVLDLSDNRRSAQHHHPVPLTSPQSGLTSSSGDEPSTAHSVSSEARTSQSPPRPSLSTRPLVQPASAQPITGVVLSTPPRGARPAAAFVHTKRQIPKSVLTAAKKMQAKAEEGQAKKRDRPPQFGEDEIKVLEVQFFDSPERSRFCNENNEFVVPKVPDSREDQDELRDALSRLYEKSNLPKVPSAFMYNVHALAYYPFMQHLFHLYLVKGIDIYDFKFGAYGQAFENPRLRDLGETEFNNRLDSMCYVGDDNLLHCLVMRHIDNGARCDHVASELGKMRRHAKNHYPEKKWVCCFCRAQMPDLTDMERHTSTHTSLKPFRCVDCNKFFSQKVTLANHMNQHHQKKLQKMDPRKSFTCRQDGCLFQDHQREACIEHLINHHRNDEYVRRSKRGMWPFPPRTTTRPGSSGAPDEDCASVTGLD